MKANNLFQQQSKTFWSQVKLVSMTSGYSLKDKIKTYDIQSIIEVLESRGLTTHHLIDNSGTVTAEGKLLVDYFKYRSKILHEIAEVSLMNRDEARKLFESIFDKNDAGLDIPYNKQKGNKRHYAYLTGMINILTTKALKANNSFDSNPRSMVVITDNKKPLRVLSRRVDGVYPSTVNPYAIWEIKEYYGTTTFGSRVADAIYETMLDGLEISELKKSEDIDIKHYLIIDDYFTWWKCGKSYLCRLVDLVHEGLIDEVLFGREIIERWPEIVSSWPKSFTKSTISDREHLLQP